MIKDCPICRRENTIVTKGEYKGMCVDCVKMLLKLRIDSMNAELNNIKKGGWGN